MKTRLIAGFFLTAVLIIEGGFVFANPGKRTYVGTYREDQDIACTVNPVRKGGALDPALSNGVKQ